MIKDNKLKVLVVGQKCKKPGKDLKWFEDAKSCSEAIAKEKTKCNFYMYAPDYPVEGCKCCEEYHTHAVDKDSKKFTIF